MANLRLRLLGGFEIAVDGEPVLLRARKAKALLAVIGVEPGRSWPREKLAAMLWEMSGEEQARTSLRQTLSVIRKILGDSATGWLRADSEAIFLDAGAVDVDVALFESLADHGDSQALGRAADLYKGDLLDGLTLREDAFEEWLRTERTRLREQVLDVMSRLVAHHSGAGAWDAGIDVAGRLLAIDPLREDIHRATMALHASAGATGAALKQFQLCRSVLKRELAIQPAPETQALYRHILEQRSAPPAPQAPMGEAVADAPLAERADKAPSHPSPALPLPAKPSIAILPFDNMSGDPGRAYFSDGITEDIITELSRNRSLFVISRRSSFAYRNSDTSVQRIGRELGVRYVLEGSVRHAGNSLRITAQLVDAPTDIQIWAECYDREIDDIFALHDEVARIIVTTLVGRLDAAAETSVRAKPTDDLEAYDLVLRALHYMQQYTRQDYAEAKNMLDRAIECDPVFARAYGLLALVHVYDWFWELSGDGCRRAIELGRKAIEFDEHEARSHIALCVAHVFTGQLDEAEYHIGRAVDLNPNDDLALVEQGRLLMYLGRPDEGAQRVREAMRLNPYHPNWYWNILGRNLHTAGRFAEAITVFKHISTPPFWVHAYLAACNACLARREEAEWHRAETIRLQPNFTLALFDQALPYNDPRAHRRFLDTLRQAGFPE